MRNVLTVQELKDRVEDRLALHLTAEDTFTAYTITTELRDAFPGDSIPHYAGFDAGGDPVSGVQDLVHDYMSAWMTANPGEYEVVTSDELSAPYFAEHYRKVVTPAALPDPTPAVVTVQATPTINIPRVIWTWQ